jgi:hypothetical protein
MLELPKPVEALKGKRIKKISCGHNITAAITGTHFQFMNQQNL